MKRLFLSDIHLNSGFREAEKQERVLELLNGLDPAEWSDIYLLGDIFDFWFEYQTVIVSAYFPFLRALARLHEGGVRLHFVPGNHDIWIGSFLRDTMEMRVYEGGGDIDLDGRRVHLFHGDGVNPTDKGSLFLTWVIRLRPLRWLLRQVNPDWVFTWGRWFSAFSRKKQEEKMRTGNTVERSWMHLYALRQFTRGIETVVGGHCHVPELVRVERDGMAHTYVNCGDWHEHFSYAVWDGTGFTLHRTGSDTRPFPELHALSLPLAEQA